MPKRKTVDKQQQEEEEVDATRKQKKEDSGAANEDNKVAAEEEEGQQGHGEDADDEESEDKPPQKKVAAKKAAEVVLQTVRDELARKSVPAHKRSFKVLSWNVNGLNGVLNGKHATLNGNKATNILQELLKREGDVDVLFLQETKLQDCKCATFGDILPGYVAYWSCSKTKKGYAGVAAFVKKAYVPGGGGGRESACGGGGEGTAGGKQQTLAKFFPAGGKKKGTKKGAETEEAANIKGKTESVLAGGAVSPALSASSPSSSSSSSSPSICSRPLAADGGVADGSTGAQGFELVGVSYGYAGDKDQDEEGRVVTLEFAGFWAVGVYVANSGMKLERLKHRLTEFNPQFQSYLARLDEKKPVLVVGDFNVAPFELDCYNHGAKHLSKVPGLTPEEREAHAMWLSSGWVDTFRAFHPTAKGQYTYWNVKTNARPENKGLRLDFALTAARDLEGGRGVKVFDSFILHEATVGYSDHAPIGVVLEVGE